LRVSQEVGLRLAEASAVDEKISQELQKRIQKEQVETWFRDFRLIAHGDNAVEFAVPTGFLRDWICNHHLGDVRAAVQEALGTDCQVTIGVAVADPILAEAPPPAPSIAEPAPLDAVAAPLGGGLAKIMGNVERNLQPQDAHHPALASTVNKSANGATKVGTKLNKNYTFHEFVVGPCNRLAHAAGLAIAASPGQAYNPLFVHGNVGLGKTHLLQSICHAIVRTTPTARVVYLSCEEFTNRFIRSIQTHSIDEFRNYFRSADVLVIDDVEFLAHKVQTQEEFFHTFNALYNEEKQIVLSSDRKAPEIPTLEDRLISRFKWGLEACIEKPCFETRVAIVRRKGLLRSVEIPDDVAHFVAERVTNNIRELEGAVVRILGLAAISGQSVGMELAEDALRDGDAPRRPKVTLSDIMELITNEFSITSKDLVGKSRTQAISLPRQIGMTLARRSTDHSLEEVGRFFGNRDHTTVLYAIGKIKQRAEQDRMFNSLLSELSHRLMTGNYPRKTR